MNPTERHAQMVSKALDLLDSETAGRFAHIAKELFATIYDDLTTAISGNPIDHHPVVLDHMLQIATGVKSPFIVPEQAAALALLHDISAVRKITTQMVKDAEFGGRNT